MIIKTLINLPISILLIYAAFAGHSIFALYASPIFFLCYLIGAFFHSRLLKGKQINSKKITLLIFLMPTIVYTGFFMLLILLFMDGFYWDLNETLVTFYLYSVFAIPNVIHELFSARNFIKKAPSKPYI